MPGCLYIELCLILNTELYDIVMNTMKSCTCFMCQRSQVVSLTIYLALKNIENFVCHPLLLHRWFTLAAHVQSKLTKEESYDISC